MSQLNVDTIKNKAGTGGPTLQALTVTTDATVTGSATIGTNLTVGGNISVAGTITYEDVTNVDSIGIVTARSGVRINSGGLIVTSGVSTFSDFVSFGSTVKTKGFVETQSSATTTSNVLNLDAANGTVFTHTTTAQIGIVSFSSIRTDAAGTQTFSVLVTQGNSPTNTTAATGIGTQLATVVTTGGVGYSTHIKVGAGSSIILTGTAGAFDLLTFIVSYDGTTPSNSAFKVVGFAATDFRNAIV